MTTNDRESELRYFKQIAMAREMGLVAAKFALDNALPLQAAKAIEIAENRCAELTAQYQQQIATPQPAPAPASELVAAVKPFARMWRKWEAYAADNTDYTVMEWLQLEYSDKEFSTIVYQFLEAYKAAALTGEGS